MVPRRFTDAFVRNLKPKDSRYEVWEGNGLGLRVTPKGRKSWVAVYHFEGRARRLTIGPYPTYSVAKAHRAHGEALELLDKGIDPGTKQVEENRVEREALTVKSLADDYINRWAKPRKRSWHEDDRVLSKEVLPLWGRRKAKDIQRRDLIRLLDNIVRRGAPITANRTLEIVRRMFNWAIEQDILETTPCLRVRAPAPEKRRDRVLTEEEIRDLWNILGQNRKLHQGRKATREEQDGLPPNWPSRAVRLALRLTLATGQRRGEIASAQLAEFDLETGWWTIPAERAKNGLSHRVPLSELALEIIGELIEIQDIRHDDDANSRDHLLPSPRGDGPIDAGALTRAAAVIRTQLKIDHWTAHDLRRTAASHMTSIGISRLTVSKLLNHVENGITAVYDRHSYDAEKKQALDTWASRLCEIIDNTGLNNVVKIFSR